MPHLAALQQIDHAERIQSVNAGRDAADSLEVSWASALRTLQNTRLADFKANDAATIRAFRQPDGCTAQLAGTSTTTHSRRAEIAAGALTPGVTYEFWNVGHNSQGDGPERNNVTHAVSASL